jgi:hypothetical protein
VASLLRVLLTENAGDDYIIGLVGGVAYITSVGDNLTVTNGELNLSGVATTTYADGVADTAEANAKSYADGLASNYDAAGAATTAENNAKSYADGLASNYDAAGAATTAENNAKSYADGLASNYDAAGAATTAENNAKSYADGLAANYEVAGAAAAAITTANGYTDTAVSNLVNGAPELLDTLNELAAAIGDDANFASTIGSQIGGKQDALTAGTGITLTGATISVTANTYDAYGAASTAQGNAEDYADTVAGTAESNAKSYADGLASNYDAAGAASTAQTNAEGYADGLVGDILNGTTEFSSINLGSLASQVATSALVATAGSAVALTFAKASYRTAKLLVKFAAGAHTEVSEVLLTLDTSDNIAITEFANIYTNASLGDVSAAINGTNVEVTVTTVNNSTTVTVVGTLLI